MTPETAAVVLDALDDRRATLTQSVRLGNHRSVAPLEAVLSAVAELTGQPSTTEPRLFPIDAAS